MTLYLMVVLGLMVLVVLCQQVAQQYVIDAYRILYESIQDQSATDIQGVLALC